MHTNTLGYVRESVRILEAFRGAQEYDIKNKINWHGAELLFLVFYFSKYDDNMIIDILKQSRMYFFSRKMRVSKSL